MPSPRRSLSSDVERDAAAALSELRQQLAVPSGFAAEVEEAATRAVTNGPRALGGVPRVDRRDLELITIDPAGSLDLDQAFTIHSLPNGYRLFYAIADVASFVTPGDPIDLESWSRGVTLYLPDQRSPLHPAALSEGGASLLAGFDRPCVLWQLDLDDVGGLVRTNVQRATVRSREALSYQEAQARLDQGASPLLGLLARVGELRIAQEAARGGISLELPEQDIAVDQAGNYVLNYRQALPVERCNAQLSLLTGMAAAQLMLSGGCGLLRTLPPAPPWLIDRLARSAASLGVSWPKSESYPNFVRNLDPGIPTEAALLSQAAHTLRGASYQVVGPEAAPGELTVHAAVAAPYAHVTAPLRRLGDRYATEASLAVFDGRAVPAWVSERLIELARVMVRCTQRGAGVENAVVDLVEALVLSPRVGEMFRAVVVDIPREERSPDRHGSPRMARIQLRSPAVVGTVAAEGLVLGAEVNVRLDSADPLTRKVVFTIRDRT